MGWDGAGNYTRQRNFSADASAGIKILASAMDQEVDDIASAFTRCWTRDGQNAPTGDLTLGGNKFTNVGEATEVNEYLRVREFIENVPLFMLDTATSADRVSVSATLYTSVSANQNPTDGSRIHVQMASDKSAPAMFLNGNSANIHFAGGPRIDGLVSGATHVLTFNSAAGVWETGSDRLYPRTATERTAGVTPTNYEYPEGNVLRYGTNTTPGTTDMTTAIQAAFDSVGDGQTVVFPPGTYLVSSNITMSSKNNVAVIGNGAILTEASGALTAMLAFTSCDFLSIRDLNFSAGEDDTYFQANDPTGDGREFISLTTCDDVSISGISGSSKRNFVTANGCVRLRISDYSFTGFAGTIAAPNTSSNQNFLWCIDIINCDYVSISGGHVAEHGNNVLSQMTSTHVTIDGLTGRDLHDNGVYISSGDGVSIRGCSFLNVIGDGVQARGDNFAITGNVFENCDDFGIAVTPISGISGSCAVTGNHMNGCERGIRISANTSQPTDVVINDNVVLNCTESANNGAIEVNSTTGRVVICGNVVRTSALDNGIFIPDNGTPCTNIVICNNLISDLNGSSASSRGGIRIDDGAELVIANNVFEDIASGIGIRLNSCDGGVVSGNLYEGGQVARIPTGESNANLYIHGNRGSTLVVDGQNNLIGANDATVTGNSETLTGTATASLVPLVSNLDSSGGAVTATCPDGTYEGQRKVFTMSDASNSSTVSVTSHETSDPEVFTFAQTTDYLVLEWSASQAFWWTVKNIGAAV